MEIDRIDHLVLTVASIDATVAFYQQAFGMRPISFADGRRGLAFGTQKINLHQRGQEYEPKAARPTPGSGDLCLIARAGPIEAIVADLARCGIAIEHGPVQQTGAAGPMMSVYVRDPDDNLVEIAVYS